MKIDLEIEYTDLEVQEMLDSQLTEIDDATVDKIEQDGFDGWDIIFYFIVTGGAASAIKDITKIIMRILVRDDVKKVKIGDIEIKGYSKKEVEKLLKEIQRNSLNKRSKK